jgi:hypothetical protein
VGDFEACLDSWNSKMHPDQIRLRAYLEQLAQALGPLPETTADLFLHMDIDVRKPDRLLRHHDVENYLAPVVRHLGVNRFVLVSATKRVGGGSQLLIGMAELISMDTDLASWSHFSCAAGNRADASPWKIGLRTALAAEHPQVLPPGSVAVQLAWRCSQRRSWMQLWKPTGDAMGPVLGEPDPRNPFNPADDRIGFLQLHRNVGMWWRPLLLAPIDPANI